MDHLLLSEREWSDFNTAKTRLAIAKNGPLCTQTFGPLFFTAIDCKLSPVRSIGDNDFLRVISWACWYYHPLLVLVNYLLCYVAIYIC